MNKRLIPFIIVLIHSIPMTIVYLIERLSIAAAFDMLITVAATVAITLLWNDK